VRRSATFQIPKYKVIPAHFSRTHTAPRPVHPRALHEASLSGTGSRWPRKGATRTPNARRLKLHGPGATVGVTGLFGGSAVTPCRTARRCSSPKRWVETTQPPGAMRRKASNTARGTLERKRTCGTTNIETPLPAGIGVCFGVATCRSPWVRWIPGVPRALGLFPKAHRPNDSGANRAARTMSHTRASSPGLTRRSMKRSSG